jgi:hypothetical protein
MTTTIEHEVRLRLLEDRHNDIKETFKDIKNELKELRTEMKSQFRWTIMLVFTFLAAVVLPVITSEVIGLIKVIKAM